MDLNIDSAIFIGFLALNLVVGLWSGSGVKNIREYAIGNRNFSTATIAASLVAVWMAGSNISITILETYNNGIYYIIPGLADGISFFIVAYFYAPRMVEFLGNLSVAEAMGNLYGRYARIITAVSAIVIGISMIAIQFAVFTALMTHFLGVSGIYATIISAVIVIGYSTFGGIKAVTFTDMIQFFTFGIVLPMVVFFVWRTINDDSAVFSVLTEHPNFNYQEFFNVHRPGFLETTFLFLFFLIPGLDPVIFQRISMAKNTKQVSRSFSIAGIAMILLEYGIIAFVGILFLAKGVPDLNSDNIIGYLLDNYFGTGFKGFFVAGMAAMLISTADSYINAISVLVAHDLRIAANIELNSKNQLLLARLAAMFAGIVAVSISLISQNLLELILTTYSFYMPVVSVSLILAIFGFRSTAKAALIGMFAGFITVLIFKLFSDISSLIPGMIANIIFFMGSHSILKQKGGWVGIKEKSPLDILRLERKRNINSIVSGLKNFSFISFCKSNLPKDLTIQVYFAIYCVISIFSNIYSLPSNIYNQYIFLIDIICYGILITSTVLITYPIWQNRFRNETFIAITWNIALIFNLIIASTLLTILGKFSQIQTIILMANLITVAVLLRWKVAIVVILGGVFISLTFYKWYVETGLLMPANIDSGKFKIIYTLLLVSSILIAFLKPKEEEQELTEEKNEHLNDRIGFQEYELEQSQELKYEFLRNIQHEARTPITGITTLGQILDENYDKLTETQKRDAVRQIAQSSERLISLVNNMIDVSKLSSLTYELKKEPVNLSDLVYSELKRCQRYYLDKKKGLEFIKDIESNITLDCDSHYIKGMIDNLVVNAIKYSKEGVIKITLKQLEGAVHFSISDDGIAIPREELHDIFGVFVVSSKTKTPAGGRGIGLALCKKVAEAHNGKIWAESDGVKGSVFSFIIPTK